MTMARVGCVSEDDATLAVPHNETAEPGGTCPFAPGFSGAGGGWAGSAAALDGDEFVYLV